MVEEIEYKFLNINEEDMDQRLRDLGAQKVSQGQMHEIFFNKPDENVDFLDSEKKSLRLRQFGEIITLTYKGPSKAQKGPKVRDEIEFELNDYEAAQAMLEELGFEKTREYTKRRTHYSFESVHFEIDQLPGEKPYLEIETASLEAMEEICKKLGMDMSKADPRGVTEIFPEKFRIRQN